MKVSQTRRRRIITCRTDSAAHSSKNGFQKTCKDRHSQLHASFTQHENTRHARPQFTPADTQTHNTQHFYVNPRTSRQRAPSHHHAQCWELSHCWVTDRNSTGLVDKQTHDTWALDL